MSRCPPLEALLAAQYEVDSAEPEDRAECQARLDRLIQEVITLHPVSRQELLAAIEPRYREYRRQRRAQERQALGKLLGP